MKGSGETEDTEGRREESEGERRRDWDVPSGPQNRGSRSWLHPLKDATEKHNLEAWNGSVVMVAGDVLT